MLTIKPLFEVPVYRLSEISYYQKMDGYITDINSKMQIPMSNGYLRKQFGGDWNYNEIIAYLRFYRYGSNKIRCEYWETDAKSKTRTRKKTFVKVSDKYCNQPFSISSPNSDLAQSIRDAVEHCENRLKRKRRVLDRELFDNTVDFIDWKSLLK